METKYRAIYSGLFFLLSGCSGVPASKQLSISESISVTAPNLNGLTREEYIAAGYNKVYSACTDYFDALIRARNDNSNNIEVLNAAGTALTTIMGLASVYSPAVGIASATFGLGNSYLMSKDKHELVTPYPDETKGLILDSLTAFSNANPPKKTATDGDAIALVQHYAEMCTYSGISRYAKEAITKATPKSDTGTTNTGAAAGAAGAAAAAAGATPAVIGAAAGAASAATSEGATPAATGASVSDAATSAGATPAAARAAGAAAAGAVAAPAAGSSPQNPSEIKTISPN